MDIGYKQDSGCLLLRDHGTPFELEFELLRNSSEVAKRGLACFSNFRRVVTEPLMRRQQLPDGFVYQSQAAFQHSEFDLYCLALGRTTGRAWGVLKMWLQTQRTVPYGALCSAIAGPSPQPCRVAVGVFEVSLLNSKGTTCGSVL